MRPWVINVNKKNNLFVKKWDEKPFKESESWRWLTAVADGKNIYKINIKMKKNFIKWLQINLILVLNEKKNH